MFAVEGRADYAAPLGLLLKYGNDIDATSDQLTNADRAFRPKVAKLNAPAGEHSDGVFIGGIVGLGSKLDWFAGLANL